MLVPYGILSTLEFSYLHVFRFLILALFVVNNRTVLTKKLIMFSLFSFLFLFLDLVKEPYYLHDTLRHFSIFFIVGLIPFYLSSYISDFEKFFKIVYFVSLAVIFVNVYTYFTGGFKFYEYMTIGIKITFPLLIVIHSFFREKRYIDLVFSIAGFAFVFTFTNRGSVLIVMAYVLLLLFKNIYTRILSIFFIVFNYITNFEYPVTFIKYILKEFEIYSYSMLRILQMVNHGMEKSSSGRDVLYVESMDMVIDKPFLGHSISYFEYHNSLNQPYPHNVFIQIFIEYGYVGLFVFAIIIFMSILKYFKIDDNHKRDFVALLAVAQLRILTSGNFLEESSFWILFGVLFYTRERRIND